MRRLAGVIIFVVGLLLVASNLMLRVAGVKGLGILGMLIGAVVFGLSFIRRPEAGADAPPPLPTADKITRVFYEPEPVFKNLRYHPHWLAAFLVVALFGAAYQIALTQRLGVERFAEDEASREVEGGFVPADKISPDDYKQAKIRAAIANATVSKATLPFNTIGFMLIGMLVLAGLYWLCVMAFGGRMNFWQALSVATYGSLPPVVISTTLSLILLYTQSPDDIIPAEAYRHGLARADLGLLFRKTNPMSNTLERPVLYSLASFIGLFQLYGWWITVQGLKHVSEKISGASAWAIALILWLFGMLITSVIFILFPTFAA